MIGQSTDERKCFVGLQASLGSVALQIQDSITNSIVPAKCQYSTTAPLRNIAVLKNLKDCRMTLSVQTPNCGMKVSRIKLELSSGIDPPKMHVQSVLTGGHLGGEGVQALLQLGPKLVLGPG